MIALLTTYLHRPLTDSAPSVPSSTIPHNEHPGLVGEAIRPMPDPVAVTAVSLLAAKALEAFSGEAGKNAWAAVERLGQLIRRKFEGDKPAEEALAAMEARPTNQLQIQTLVEVLDIRAKHDQNFRGSLVKLVGEAEATGAIQIIKSEHIGVVAGRDVIIESYNPPPPPEKRPPTGRILSPESGRRVPRLFDAEGTLSDIPTSRHIWIAVEIGGLLWPKEPEIPSQDHYWSQRIAEHGNPPGGWFSLVLLMADTAGHRMIEDWLNTGRSTRDYPGLSHIPGVRLHVVPSLILKKG
jgi:hypothetical protein